MLIVDLTLLELVVQVSQRIEQVSKRAACLTKLKTCHKVMFALATVHTSQLKDLSLFLVETLH